MLLERAIALDPGSLEALEALEAVDRRGRRLRRLADVLERKLEVAARGPVEQKEILARLAESTTGRSGDPIGRASAQTLARHAPASLAPAPTAGPARRRRRSAAAPPPPPAPAAGAAAARAGQQTTPPGRKRLRRRSPPAARAPRRAAISRARRQAYWRAASTEAEPGLRANYLVSHARVLLARGEVKTARTSWRRARERAPRHAGALALLADISYRTQDWTRARDCTRRSRRGARRRRRHPARAAGPPPRRAGATGWASSPRRRRSIASSRS